MNLPNIQQFFRIICARWLVACSAFGVVVLATIAICVFAPRQYTATASAVIDAKNDPIVGAVTPEQLSNTYLATQVDIMTSQRVAERVVKLLHLDEDPQLKLDWQKRTKGAGDPTAWLAAMLQKQVRVGSEVTSNVITITAKSTDPHAVAPLANAYIKAYMETTVDLKVEPAKQYSTWFDQRSRDLRADLELKQHRLADFQNQSSIIASDERFDIENTRLSELSSQLTAIQVQRQDSQSLQSQVGQGHNENLPAVLQSPVITGLKADLAREEAKLQYLGSKLGTNHPDYQSEADDVASLRARIEQEINNVTGSLRSATQSNLRRERDLQQALEKQKAHVLELKHQRDELTDLQNDVAAAQRNLDMVSQRLAQSTLESQLQQTNVIGLTAATDPVAPASPNVPLDLELGVLLGVVLGLGAALILEWIDPRLRSQAEVEQILSAPVLGRIRSAKYLISHDQPSRPALMHGGSA
jgi:chain length determinant protein EpsF